MKTSAAPERPIEREGSGETPRDAVGKRAWPVVEFGTVCDVQLGKMLSPKSKVGTRPVPYLRNENVQWARFDLTDVSWMDFTEAEERKFRLEPGDLLACEGGEPGRAAIWQGQIARCCYQKALHRIRPRAGLVHPPFVLYRLWLSSLAGEFTGSQTQTTIAHLPREKLIRLSIPLPPLAEQERIAAKLTEQLAAVDRAREAAQARLAAAEALPAALLREVFEGPEASGWEAVRLSNILAETRNGLYKPDKFYGSGVPIIKMYNIGRFDSRWYLDRLDLIRLDPAEHAMYRLEPGDIVINRVNSRELVGKAAVIDERLRGAVFESKNIRARVGSNADPHFFTYWLNSAFARAQIESRIKQIVGQATLNRDDLASLEMPNPPLPTQRRLAAELTRRLAAAEGVIARCREELAAIEALPAALLRQAFGGSEVSDG